MKHLSLIFFLFAPSLLLAQTTTLQWMNGKIMNVYNFDDSTHTELHFTFDQNSFKRERLNIRLRRKSKDYFNNSLIAEKSLELPVVLREGAAEREEIFSATDSLGKENFYYYVDEMSGNDLSIPSMRAFIQGERDARLVVSGRGWFYSGLALGAVAGFASRQSILVLAVPPLFALSATIPVVRIRENYVSDSQYINNADFAGGYESYARSKHTREGLKGSALGILIGLVSFTIIDNNR